MGHSVVGHVAQLSSVVPAGSGPGSGPGPGPGLGRSGVLGVGGFTISVTPSGAAVGWTGLTTPGTNSVMKI